MKINLSLLAAVMLTMLFTACQPKKAEDAAAPPPEQVCHITKITDSDSLGVATGYIAEYEFDNLSRLVKVKAGNSTDYATTILTYSGNTVSRSTVHSDSPNNETTTATMNGAGNATVAYNSARTTSGTTLDTIYYEYNTNNYLTKKTSKTKIVTYNYVNGNAETIVTTGISGNIINTQSVEFDVSKTPKIDPFNYPFIKTGKLDVNLPKRTRTIDESGSQSMDTYTWTLSADNKVTEYKYKYYNNGALYYHYVSKLDYTCK